MLASLFKKMESVHIARTRDEREAIHRLRFKVYIQELNKQLVENVDHDGKRIVDEEDEQEGTMLLFTGRPPDISGTVRIQRWAPGQAPDHVRQRYSFHVLPGIDELVTGEAARLVIEPGLRGKMVMPSLTLAAYERACMGPNSIDVIFQYCAPGLVKAYQRIGWRPYPGEPVYTEDGVRVPLLLLIFDTKHLRDVGSPLASLACRLHGAGMRNDRAKGRLAEALEEGRTRYSLDSGAVRREIQDGLLDEPASGSMLLKDLTGRQLKMLASQGFTMEVPAGTAIIRQGLMDKEMFLIVEGLFEVRWEDAPVAILGKGDVFGEIALFMDSSRRTAHVRSITPGKVLVLRRKFIQELARRNSALGQTILTNLCRILAKRLAGTTRNQCVQEVITNRPSALDGRICSTGE